MAAKGKPVSRRFSPILSHSWMTPESTAPLNRGKMEVCLEKSMGPAEPATGFDFAAYLEWEEEQPEKHEYYRGQTFAMTGARRAHVTVALNLATAFRAHLRGGPCRTYISDMKLRVEAADAAFYPDVMVTCDPRDHRADTHLCYPALVVEVLSESTAAYDRGKKFAAYRKLESLKEFTMVDIDARRIECFRREGGHWVLYEFAGDESCEFGAVGLTLPLSAVFEDADAADEAAS